MKVVVDRRVYKIGGMKWIFEWYNRIVRWNKWRKKEKVQTPHTVQGTVWSVVVPSTSADTSYLTCCGHVFLYTPPHTGVGCKLLGWVINEWVNWWVNW